MFLPSASVEAPTSRVAKNETWKLMPYAMSKDSSVQTSRKAWSGEVYYSNFVENRYRFAKRETPLPYQLRSSERYYSLFLQNMYPTAKLPTCSTDRDWPSESYFSNSEHASGRDECGT